MKKYVTLVLLCSFLFFSLNSQKCDAYYNEKSENFPLIVGGVPVDDPDKYPWMAGIVLSEEVDLFNAHFCGGTLITPNWVLTAAHCFVGEEEDGYPVMTPDQIEVILGTIYLDDPNPNYERIAITRMYLHPGYNPRESEDNDIALIRLSQASQFTPVDELATLDEHTEVGRMKTAIGWGGIQPQPGPEQEFPIQLQEVELPIVDLELCQDGMEDDDSILTENMFCAGLVEGGKDTCQGDSGGPFVGSYNAGYMLAGVVSWGEGCAQEGSYGVYTKVSQYNEWINGIIESEVEAIPTLSQWGTLILSVLMLALGGFYMARVRSDKHQAV